MKKSKIGALIACGMIVAATVAGVAWAAQKPAGSAEAGTPIVSGGRYAISPSGDSSILLDTVSGDTWVLARGVRPAEPVWLKITKRLDSEAQVYQWRAIQLHEEKKRGR